MSYWYNREERAKIAEAHYESIKEQSSDKVAECVNKTIIYDDKSFKTTDFKKPYDYTDISVVDMDTVTAAFKYRDFIPTVLNFASYKNPGGKFIEGSCAQEESLCHASILYNVLEQFKDTYYAFNNQHKNKALYLNRALYSPCVLFKSNFNLKFFSANVITCAAPNKVVGQRYNNVTIAENYQELIKRIEFILKIAAEQGAEVLILGAFGCGVFGQAPIEVANVFKGFLRNEFNSCFKKVIFAIPDKESYNYLIFEKIMRNDL